MATFNLFLNTGQIDKSLSGSYDLLFNQYGYTGNLSLNGVGNYRSGVNVTTHFGVGGKSYLTGDLNSFGNSYLNGKSYLNDFNATGNTFLSQITGGLRVTGDINHTGNSRRVGDVSLIGQVDQTGNINLTGDINIGGTLYINGVAYSPSILTESANSSTGDFYVSGNLFPLDKIQASGNPSSIIGDPIVGLTGFNSNRNLVELVRGSLFVTGNGLDTGYFRGAHKSLDGTVGASASFSIFDSNSVGDHQFVFKDGLLTFYAFDPA